MIIISKKLFMTKHLKDRSYYENIYDNWMIEACVRIKNITKKHKPKNEDEKRALLMVEGQMIYAEKHEYYKNRDEKIEKMMNDDRKRDELYENSIPFKGRYCRKCNWLLEYEFKHFYSWIDSKPDRILFFYKCNDCKKRQGIYNDWEEVISKPKLCNKCNEIIDLKTDFKWDILTEKYNCKNCWNKYTETTDYSVKKESKEEEKISEKDRLEYWYTKKDKDSLMRFFDNMEKLSEIVKKQEEKDKKKNVYEKAKKLNKLNVIWLQKLLNKEFEKTKFSDFKINSNKEVRRWLEIEFNLFFDWNFWENPKLELNKLFEKVLIKTNWKATKDSIHEKLGIISGRLIWYDNEDDLADLIEKRDSKKR